MLVMLLTGIGYYIFRLCINYAFTHASDVNNIGTWCVSNGEEWLFGFVMKVKQVGEVKDFPSYPCVETH